MIVLWDASKNDSEQDAKIDNKESPVIIGAVNRVI